MLMKAAKMHSTTQKNTHRNPCDKDICIRDYLNSQKIQCVSLMYTKVEYDYEIMVFQTMVFLNQISDHKKVLVMTE